MFFSGTGWPGLSWIKAIKRIVVPVQKTLILSSNVLSNADSAAYLLDWDHRRSLVIACSTSLSQNSVVVKTCQCIQSTRPVNQPNLASVLWCLVRWVLTLFNFFQFWINGHWSLLLLLLCWIAVILGEVGQKIPLGSSCSICFGRESLGIRGVFLWRMSFHQCHGTEKH